jgi:hypothetical protein
MKRAFFRGLVVLGGLLLFCAPSAARANANLYVGSGEGAPGQTSISIPLTMDGVAGALAIDATVTYDPDLLSLTGVTRGSLLTEGTFTPNLSFGPGVAKLDWYDTSELPGDSGEFAQLQFSVMGTAMPWTISDLGGTSYVDEVTPMTVHGGTFTVTPEPSSLILLAAGLGGGLPLCWLIRRRARRD